MNTKSLVCILAVGIAGCALLVSKSRATEPQPFTTIQKDGDFEIRDYPAFKVASTPMASDGMDNSFRYLFRYITGANKGSQKIAMTAPVLIEPEAAESKGRTMSFIMPKDVQEAPLPTDAKVAIGTRPAKRFAVYRYSGGRNPQNEASAKARLQEWMTAQKLEATGQAVFAYFDPPWIPTFLRHNEVMLPLANPGKAAP